MRHLSPSLFWLLIAVVVLPSLCAQSVISINYSFESDKNAMSAGMKSGAPGVHSAHWNNVNFDPEEESAISDGFVFDDGTSVDGLTVVMRPPDKAGVYSYEPGLFWEGGDPVFRSGIQVAADVKSYNRFTEVEITGIPFTRYDVYVYYDSYLRANGKRHGGFVGEDIIGNQTRFHRTGIFNAGMENDSPYVLSEDMTLLPDGTDPWSSESWGTSSNTEANYTKFSGLSGDLSAAQLLQHGVGLPDALGQTYRHVAGIQIVNTSTEKED